MTESQQALVAKHEKRRDRLLAAVLWVFWSGVMLLTGFLYAMNIV